MPLTPVPLVPRQAPDARPRGGGLAAQWVEPGHHTLPQVAQVIEDRFPDDECDDWGTLLRRHREGRVRIATVSEGPDAAVAGVAVVAMLPRTGSACLLYLAAHRDASVPGVGLALLHFLRMHLPEHGVRIGFLGEIERAEDAADAIEATMRRRRLLYYRRFGCRVIPQLPGYGMPDMTTGDDLLPLHLVWLPHQLQLEDLTGGLIRELVTELYDVAYARAPGDALLSRVLDSMPREVAG